MNSDNYAVFDDLGFFVEVPDEPKARLKDSIGTRKLVAAETLLEQGETCNSVYCVVCGLLTITVDSGDGAGGIRCHRLM